ncbi:MAG: hypothetical protein H7829_01335 [Magnetococcus sp. THC-1_WYH]
MSEERMTQAGWRGYTIYYNNPGAHTFCSAMLPLDKSEPDYRVSGSRHHH